MITLNCFSLYNAKNIISIVHGTNSPWYERYMVGIIHGTNGP